MWTYVPRRVFLFQTDLLRRRLIYFVPTKIETVALHVSSTRPIQIKIYLDDPKISPGMKKLCKINSILYIESMYTEYTHIRSLGQWFYSVVINSNDVLRTHDKTCFINFAYVLVNINHQQFNNTNYKSIFSSYSVTFFLNTNKSRTIKIE